MAINLISFMVLKKPPLFDLEIVYSYVIEIADSESDLGLHSSALVSETAISTNKTPAAACIVHSY